MLPKCCLGVTNFFLELWDAFDSSHDRNCNPNTDFYLSNKFVRFLLQKKVVFWSFSKILDFQNGSFRLNE